MDPLSAAIALAPLALGALRKKKKGPNRNAILARYRASQPKGYTTEEDQQMAERARTRIAGSAQAIAQQRRVENNRQIAARGLSGPAAAALEQDATDVAAQGSEEAARTSADLLYRSFESNLGYERNKNDTAFGAELGLAQEEAARGQAQESTFWNSALGVIPGLASAFAPAPAAVSLKSAHANVRAPSPVVPVAPVTSAQRRVRGPQQPYR